MLSSPHQERGWRVRPVLGRDEKIGCEASEWTGVRIT